MPIPKAYEPLIMQGMKISNEILNFCKEERDIAREEAKKIAPVDPPKAQKIVRTALKVSLQPLMTPVQKMAAQNVEYLRAQAAGVAITVDMLVDVALGLTIITNPLLHTILTDAIEIHKTRLMANKEMEEAEVTIVDFDGFKFGES